MKLQNGEWLYEDDELEYYGYAEYEDGTCYEIVKPYHSNSYQKDEEITYDICCRLLEHNKNCIYYTAGVREVC